MIIYQRDTTIVDEKLEIELLLNQNQKNKNTILHTRQSMQRIIE